MCYCQLLLTKLLKLGILFLTAVKAIVVAYLVILGILPLTWFMLALGAELVAKLVILGNSLLTSFILALRVVLVAKLVISGILCSIFFILALRRCFLRRSFFITWLSLLKSTATGTNYLSILLFKLLKLAGTFLNLSISNLCKPDFKLA